MNRVYHVRVYGVKRPPQGEVCRWAARSFNKPVQHTSLESAQEHIEFMLLNRERNKYENITYAITRGCGKLVGERQ